MSETSPLLLRIAQEFGEAVIATHSFRGDDTATVRRESILEVLRFLKETPELGFEMLTDVTAVDYLKYRSTDTPGPAFLAHEFLAREREPQSARFSVVYHLYSLTHNRRIRLKVPVEESDAAVPSATPLWPIADWLEREVWDMFGIKFVGHPDLRRILTYEEFEGHALRKDYPLRKRQPLAPTREGWEWAADQTVSFPKTDRFDAMPPSKRERE